MEDPAGSPADRPEAGSTGNVGRGVVRIHGLVWDPERGEQGGRREADLDEAGLSFDGPASTPIPLASLRLDAGGFSEDQLQFRWIGAAGEASMVLSDPDLVAALLSRPPAGLGSQVEAFRTRVARGRARGRRTLIAVGLVFVSPVLLIVLAWVFLDPLVDLAVKRVPVSWEEEMGQGTVDSFAARGEVVGAGVAVEALRGIGERLIGALGGTPYTYRWHVVEDDDVNAFAAPGGFVVVTTAMLREAASPEEVAGVLAHEIQHVELRHGVRGVLKRLGFRAILAVLIGGEGGLLETAGVAGALGELKFGRDQEREADRRGFALLVNARVDPRGMQRFFDRLAERGDQVPGLLSTHPASAERSRDLQRLLDTVRDRAWEPLAIDWPAVRMSVGR